jgi:hypothetical protein
MLDQNITTAAVRPIRNDCRERVPPSKSGSKKFGMSAPIACLSCAYVIDCPLTALRSCLYHERGGVGPQLGAQGLLNGQLAEHHRGLKGRGKPTAGPMGCRAIGWACHVESILPPGGELPDAGARQRQGGPRLGIFRPTDCGNCRTQWCARPNLPAWRDFYQPRAAVQNRACNLRPLVRLAC